MTRFCSNLYNTMNRAVGPVGLMLANPVGKLTGCGGQISLGNTAESIIEKLRFFA